LVYVLRVEEDWRLLGLCLKFLFSKALRYEIPIFTEWSDLRV